MAEGKLTTTVRRWFRRHPDLETHSHIIADYNSTFDTENGRKALTYFLAQACFFSETVDEETVALNNYAKQILRDMGIWSEGNAKAIVDALLDHVERKSNGRPV